MSTGVSTTPDSPADENFSTSASGAPQSTEQRLFEAMDLQAIRFINMLEDDSKDEDGHAVVDISLKMKVFEMGQNWLVRRQKLKPKDDGEGSGVTELRELMNNPAILEFMDRRMFELGYVKAPVPKTGRPRKEELPVRERHKAWTEATKARDGANDDSGFQKMLGGDDG